MLNVLFSTYMHAKNYGDPSTGSEKNHSFGHIGISYLLIHKVSDLRSVVTLEVTGRFRPDFACLISHFVSLCTPKIIEIAAVLPKIFTHLATLGSVVFVFSMILDLS